jgi:hypothetical protein
VEAVMKTTMTIVALSAVLAAAATARAQSAAPTDPESPTTATARASGPPAEVGADPNIDRGFILPTAMNQPAGSGTYNNYELLLHGFTYGITNRAQFTVTVLSPIVKDMPFLGIAAIKGQVVALPRFYLALQGSAGFFHTLGGSGQSDGAGTVGGGAFATACLREDCSSLLTGSATYQLMFDGSSSNNTAQMVVYGGSIVHAVSPHVKVLGEVASAAGKVGGDYDNLSGALVSYGVRFHNSSLASDVGFMKPIVASGSDDFLLGLPFVNVSYRWQ